MGKKGQGGGVCFTSALPSSKCQSGITNSKKSFPFPFFHSVYCTECETGEMGREVKQRRKKHQAPAATISMPMFRERPGESWLDPCDSKRRDKEIPPRSPWFSLWDGWIQSSDIRMTIDIGARSLGPVSGRCILSWRDWPWALRWLILPTPAVKRWV